MWWRESSRTKDNGFSETIQVEGLNYRKQGPDDHKQAKTISEVQTIHKQTVNKHWFARGWISEANVQHKNIQ